MNACEKTRMCIKYPIRIEIKTFMIDTCHINRATHCSFSLFLRSMNEQFPLSSARILFCLLYALLSARSHP